MTESDDSIQTKLVKIRSLELQHGVDTLFTDLLSGIPDILSTCHVSETGLDQLLSMLDKQVPDLLVPNRSDLDELGETVTCLSLREGLEEREIEEGVDGCVVCSESARQYITSYVGAEREECDDLPVLELPVVESDLDGYTSIDQTDQSGGDSDKVGSSPVRGASETSDIGNDTTSDGKHGLCPDDSEVVHGVNNDVEGLVISSGVADHVQKNSRPCSC